MFFKNIGNFKKVYVNNNDLAYYFLLKDDFWLSDYFFEKCLKTVQDKSHILNEEFLAEAHSNLGLAYERQSKKKKKIINFYFFTYSN